MDTSFRFRRLLVDRVLNTLGILTLASPLTAACAGQVAGQDAAGGGGGAEPTSSSVGGPTGVGGAQTGAASSSVGSGPTSSSAKAGSTSTSVGAGGASVASSGVGAGPTSSSVGAGPTSSGVGAGGASVTSSGVGASTGSSAVSSGTGFMCGGGGPECLPLTEAGCPNTQEALSLMMQCVAPDYCWIVSVDEGPFITQEGCCYAVTRNICGIGRPFIVERAAVTAAVDEARREQPVDASANVGDWYDASLRPSLDGLDPEMLTALANDWTRDALMEHASVASFSRFSLELMAAGAPSSLVQAAHLAALDEIRHANLCFALASAYARAAVQPGPFPIDAKVDIATDLADIAARTVVEGCIGETLAAIQAAEQLGQAKDPAVRAVLGAIVEDESRHAELAWSVVAWALAKGGAPVRRAVVEAFAAASHGSAPLAEGRPRSCRDHGRLDDEELQLTLARAMNEVVRPCARALLDADAGELPVRALPGVLHEVS